MALSLALAVSATPASAQTPPQDPQLTAYAKAWVALNQIRDSMHAELAMQKNKKVEDQTKLREDYSERIISRLKALGFTQAKFDSLTYLVSVDSTARAAFEGAVVALEAKKP